MKSSLLQGNFKMKNIQPHKVHFKILLPANAINLVVIMTGGMLI